MPSIAEFMQDNHKTCDNDFALAEEAALSGEWEQAQNAFIIFRDEMARHFRMEKEQLFPALTAAGGPGGPVQVMLMEHEQINDLLRQLEAALSSRNSLRYAGISETLLIVMQQHNLKEEQILYPIADRLLVKDSAAMLQRMQAA
ncbi:MAG: hemerythrin domain-containing protein [Sideroxydans sp.]|nr:hemerythrin domain-containing protein [Sideroxydans sp.]